jgi:hypothetical protein
MQEPGLRAGLLVLVVDAEPPGHCHLNPRPIATRFSPAYIENNSHYQIRVKFPEWP